MSEVVGFVGMSHSPFATMTPPGAPADPGARFVADVERVAAAVARLAPDAVVVIGPDHFHANFYDVMPPFVLGVEEAPQAVVQTRRTDFVARLGTGQVLFHLSIIGSAGNFFEADM